MSDLADLTPEGLMNRVKLRGSVEAEKLILLRLRGRDVVKKMLDVWVQLPTDNPFNPSMRAIVIVANKLLAIMQEAEKEDESDA